MGPGPRTSPGGDRLESARKGQERVSINTVVYTHT